VHSVAAPPAGGKNHLELRTELEWLRSRYDCGTTPVAVHRVIKELETQIAWLEHGAAEQVRR
jgi:hypothetical protein